MKPLLPKIILGLLFCPGWLAYVTEGRSQERAGLPQELEAYLQLASSDSASERISGFRKLGNYWSAGPVATSTGFSDTPIQPQQEPPRPALPDEQIEAIARSVEKGLGDEQAGVREAAAIALCTAPRPLPAVMSAIEAGLATEDTTVLWYAGQQAVRTPPQFDRIRSSLISMLSKQDFSAAHTATELFRVYGEEAEPFTAQIVKEILRHEGLEANVQLQRQVKMYALWDTGLTHEAARLLVDGCETLSDDEAGIAFLALLEHPAHLKVLYAKRPDVIETLERNAHRLFAYLCKHQSEPSETRDWLSGIETLPPSAMAMLGHARYLPELRRLEQQASPHSKTFLRACQRACGSKPDRIVTIDREDEGDFRPRSTWPGSDERRMDENASGFGCGATFVMVTGELHMTDGKPPQSVSFFDVNDRMLLGTSRNEPAPVLYNPVDGRFLFFTSVFAAYAKGDEPGPYQTGSALVRIEARNCVPKLARFYDEMPHVSIRLTPVNLE